MRLEESFTSIIDYIISNDADIYDSNKNTFAVYNSSFNNVKRKYCETKLSNI